MNTGNCGSCSNSGSTCTGSGFLIIVVLYILLAIILGSCFF